MHAGKKLKGMQDNMDRFLIVTNDGKDADHIITRKVKELLETEGKKCVLCQKDEKKLSLIHI